MHASHLPPEDRFDRLVAGLPILLTIEQAAEQLGVTHHYLRRLVSRGEIGVNKLRASQQGRVRIPRDAVAAYLRRTAA